MLMWNCNVNHIFVLGWSDADAVFTICLKSVASRANTLRCTMMQDTALRCVTVSRLVFKGDHILYSVPSDTNFPIH